LRQAPAHHARLGPTTEDRQCKQRARNKAKNINVLLDRGAAEPRQDAPPGGKICRVEAGFSSTCRIAGRSVSIAANRILPFAGPPEERGQFIRNEIEKSGKVVAAAECGSGEGSDP
jgi:hypothetical protein